MLKSLELSLTHHTKPSSVTTSVVSAKAMQSKQALFLHQALLPVLFCCSALKLMFPDQCYTSYSFFLGLYPFHIAPTLFLCTFHCVPPPHPLPLCQGGIMRAPTPSSNQVPFFAPLLQAPSIMRHRLPFRMANFQSFHFPKL